MPIYLLWVLSFFNEIQWKQTRLCCVSASERFASVDWIHEYMGLWDWNEQGAMGPQDTRVSKGFSESAQTESRKWKAKLIPCVFLIGWETLWHSFSNAVSVHLMTVYTRLGLHRYKLRFSSVSHCNIFCVFASEGLGTDEACYWRKPLWAHKLLSLPLLLPGCHWLHDSLM